MFLCVFEHALLISKFDRLSVPMYFMKPFATFTYDEKKVSDIVSMKSADVFQDIPRDQKRMVVQTRF